MIGGEPRRESSREPIYPHSVLRHTTLWTPIASIARRRGLSADPMPQMLLAEPDWRPILAVIAGPIGFVPRAAVPNGPSVSQSTKR